MNDGTIKKHVHVNAALLKLSSCLSATNLVITCLISSQYHALHIVQLI